MDYDNTNRGAAFPPMDKQTLILTGNLHIEDDKKQIAIVKDEDQQGREVLVVYQRIGCMYGNKDSDDSNNQPHYSGPINDNHRVAAWRKKTEGGSKYLSLKRSEKYTPQAVDNVSRETTDGMKSVPASELVKDEIPF